MSKITKNAFTRLKKKAANGNAEDQFQLANVYAYGLVKDLNVRDRAEAFKWAEKAAEQDHVDALAFMGDALLWAKGVEHDPARAMKLLDKAARKGSAEAYHSIRSYKQTLKEDRDLIVRFMFN